MVKEINTNKAPAAIGPYSQAIQAGDFIYSSGQLGFDPSNGELVEGIEKQTHQALKNLKTILEEANTDFSKIVKVTVYLSSMENFEAVNEIYSSYFEKPYPARTAFEVGRLPKDALIELEAVVYLG